MQEHTAHISAPVQIKPRPPQRQDKEFEERTEEIIYALIRASIWPEPAWHLSCAFNSARKMHGAFISREQRDRLIEAISQALIEAVDSVPRYARARLSAGLQALKALAMMWGAEPLPRSPADVRDWTAIARICQNEMHNVSLRSEIEIRRQRSSQRPRKLGQTDC